MSVGTPRSQQPATSYDFRQSKQSPSEGQLIFCSSMSHTSFTGGHNHSKAGRGESTILRIQPKRSWAMVGLQVSETMFCDEHLTSVNSKTAGLLTWGKIGQGMVYPCSPQETLEACNHPWSRTEGVQIWVWKDNFDCHKQLFYSYHDHHFASPLSCSGCWVTGHRSCHCSSGSCCDQRHPRLNCLYLHPQMTEKTQLCAWCVCGVCGGWLPLSHHHSAV